MQFSTAAPPILQVWREPALVHGFIGRRGGFSRGVYESMNLSQFVGDVPADVTANWERLRTAVGPGIKFTRLNQVHGGEVLAVTHANSGERRAADGMVTCDRGIALGIYTADCVPILMTTRGADVACALHAGWRGVLADIATNGVHSIEQLGGRAAEVRVALGPSIGSCCFEVDADLAARFAAELPLSTKHAREGRPGKAYLNLRAIVREQLIAAGVPPAAIEIAGPCTRCANDQYFSRRAAGGITTGLQLSFVGLAG